MKDEDTFKSTYEILDELAQKWSSFTDIQQASITELIAGKRQENIISALMSNFDIAREATETAYNSEGSALKELENYQSGIEYSIDNTKASFQELSTTLVSSDAFKAVVDSAGTLLEIMTQIVSVGGGLPALFAAIGGTQFVRNLDQTKSCLQINLLLNGSTITKQAA